MNRELIILISTAILATGCASTGGGAGIQVTELTAQPTQIIEGSTVNTRIEAVNSGNLEGTVQVGDNGNEVLVNHCPDIFSIEEFSASSSRENSNQESYDIGQNERIRMNWRLDQKDDRTIPRDGISCDLRYEVPFDYSVTAYKQIQVKQNREVEGTPELASDISEGPLSINMEVIGGTSDQENTIIKGDDADIYLQLQNTKETESSYLGLIEIHEVKVETTGDVEINENCGKGAVLEVGGEQVYRCNISYEDFDTSSITGAVEASINYTFVKDAGTQTVEVKRRGN